MVVSDQKKPSLWSQCGQLIYAVDVWFADTRVRVQLVCTLLAIQMLRLTRQCRAVDAVCLAGWQVLHGCQAQHQAVARDLCR